MRLTAGVDEVGRGPLAGPVVAAAVILEGRAQIDGLCDSKLLRPARRVSLASEIRSKAVAWAVASASVEEIDEINILEASLLAMRRAVEALTRPPQHVLVDGNRCPRLACSAEAVVRGDSSIAAISAASILAKVTRDAQMVELHRHYPQYGFAKHKGYATREHMARLKEHGACPEHRRSFAPVRQLLQVELL